MFVSFKAQSATTTNNLYFYIDDVSVVQGQAPSCLSPSSVTVTSLSSTSATLSWNAITPTPTSGYEYYNSQTNAAPSVAGTSTLNTSASFSGLTPDGTYYFWVRSMCPGEQSVWFGPFIYKTLCASFAVPFLETFDSDSDTEHCWTVVNANNDAQTWNMNYTLNSINGNQSASLSTSGTAGANDDWLISPRITLTGNERLKFNYRGFDSSKPNDFMVKLSTTGNTPADFTTVVMPSTIVSSFDVITKTISLTDYAGDVYIAFHVPPGGLNGSRLFIDDVAFEISPTVAPPCISILNTVASLTCGNYPTTFTWEEVPGADGYKISIGTSALGQDLVIDNLDLGLTLDYSFIGVPGTEYFYTIKPYAGNFTAIECDEDSFVTATNGCYCPAVPTSKDGGGISVVQIGDTTVAVGVPTYVSFVEDGPIDVIQQVPTDMNITLTTGYAYGTNIWIDYNNNFVFEPSERVFSGISTNQNPTILNTTFTVPATVATGQYNMRIVAKDGSPNPADPCFNGEYGAVTDFLINVTAAPSCLPASQTSVSNITGETVQVNWVSNASSFNLQYDFAGFILGAGNNPIQSISGYSTTLSNLVPQSDYAYYIQSNCGEGDVSPWAGPFLFRTGCAPVGSFVEIFTTDTDKSSPECWSTIVTSTNTYANVKNGASGDNMVFLNGGDVGAGLYLITPALTDLPLNTHILKFKAYSTSNNTSLAIGTMTDPTNSATSNCLKTSLFFIQFSLKKHSKNLHETLLFTTFNTD